MKLQCVESWRHCASVPVTAMHCALNWSCPSLCLLQTLSHPPVLTASPTHWTCLPTSPRSSTDDHSSIIQPHLVQLCPTQAGSSSTRITQATTNITTSCHFLPVNVCTVIPVHTDNTYTQITPVHTENICVHTCCHTHSSQLETVVHVGLQYNIHHAGCTSSQYICVQSRVVHCTGDMSFVVHCLAVCLILRVQVITTVPELWSLQHKTWPVHCFRYVCYHTLVLSAKYLQVIRVATAGKL